MFFIYFFITLFFNFKPPSKSFRSLQMLQICSKTNKQNQSSFRHITKSRVVNQNSNKIMNGRVVYEEGALRQARFARVQTQIGKLEQLIQLWTKVSVGVV